ncbi:hypothetical protein AGMMS50229_06450 [Campylobacterota bacterium]|nr:hypothetical protein AGMMS50229_06450 [Campylobacterota bacterium]
MKAVRSYIRENGVLLFFFISAVSVFALTLYANNTARSSHDMMVHAIQTRLENVAFAASQIVSAAELDKFHTKEDSETPEYAALREKLFKFAADYGVEYVYYWRVYGEDQIQYIVDNDTDPETQSTTETFFERDPEVTPVIAGEMKSSNLGEYTPTWDGLITGFARVFDENGSVYCVAGVDIKDDEIVYQYDLSITLYTIQTVSLVISIALALTLLILYKRKFGELQRVNTNLQKLVEEETHKALALHETFGRYLSDEIVKDLLESPQGLSLGGKKQNITVLISDIRNFTAIAEGMRVEDAVLMLNHYFSVMVDVIHKNKGTVIEFLGDGILAIFGAPVSYEQHADYAIACALEMQIAIDIVNNYNSEHNYPPLEIGVGIDTGEAIVGNIGSSRVMKYNVVGRSVNLASRIEGYSTGAQVLISEASRRAVKAQVHVEQVLEVHPKGVQSAINIYQIDSIGKPFSLALIKEQEELKRFETPIAVSCYKVKKKAVVQIEQICYILSVSSHKAMIVADKTDLHLDELDNIKLVSAAKKEAFAKVVKTSHHGVVSIRFTAAAKEFIASL